MQDQTEAASASALAPNLPAHAVASETGREDRTTPMDSDTVSSEGLLGKPDSPQDAMQADNDPHRTASAAPSSQMDTSADEPELTCPPVHDVQMSADTTPTRSISGSAPDPSFPPSSALQSTRLTDEVPSQSSTPRPTSAQSAAQILSEGSTVPSSTVSAPAAHARRAHPGMISPSATAASDLVTTRIDRPRQHSLHQSDDTHSASTPASNSDDGTVHTSETSSGKSRALSDDSGVRSLIQKLPVAVIERILIFARCQAYCGPFPTAVREDITPVSPQHRMVQWAMMTWGMGWLFPLRTLCRNFAHAVRMNGHWEDYVRSVCQARDEPLDQRRSSYFEKALLFQRDMCFACSMNGTIYDARTQESPQLAAPQGRISIYRTNRNPRLQLNAVFAASLGRFIPLCEVHDTAQTDELPALCSNCFLDERRFWYHKSNGQTTCVPRHDVDITYVEDEERFPQAENICSTCRHEAFLHSAWSEDPIFRRYTAPLRQTVGYSNYVYLAEGTASEAAKSGIEQLWLETATGFGEMKKHQQLQKRRERLKRLEQQREVKRRERELLRSILNTEGADSSSELSNDEEDDAASSQSIRFEDEDADGNIMLNAAEERWVRDRAWHDWCKNRLDMGLWRSAHDQEDAEMAFAQNGMRHVPPRILVRGLPTKPSHEPVDDTTAVAMEAPALPPMTLYHRACRMWDEVALPEFFKLPLQNIVDILRTREDGFELSLEMDFASLFTWLRKPEAWALPLQPQVVAGGNTAVLASRFFQVPHVPNSPLDVGPGTVARIMEMWKRACAPLGECDCGICRRQKRKRSHDEVDRGVAVANNPRAVQPAPNPAQTMVAPNVCAANIDAQGTILPGGGLPPDTAAKVAIRQTQGDVQQNASPEHFQEEMRSQEPERDPNDAEGPRKVARVEGGSSA